MFRDYRICLYQKFKDSRSLRNVTFDTSRAFLLRDDPQVHTRCANLAFRGSSPGVKPRHDATDCDRKLPCKISSK